MSIVQHILVHLSRKWGLLTPSNRANWANWAANNPQPDGFGGTFQLDGNQAFMKLNHTAIRLFTSTAEQADPPTAEPPAVVDTLVAGDIIPGGFTLTWTHLGTPVLTDLNEVSLAGPFDSAGRTSIENRFRYYSDVPGTNVQKSITDLREGAWYWARVRYVCKDGQVTPWIRAQVKTGVTP